jgi:hypothetical protein
MAMKKKGVQPEADILKEAKNAEKLRQFKKTIAEVKKTEQNKK